MAFCVNCGQQLGEGAKFCTNCGQTVTTHKTESSERKTVYDGEIHKCPNCGEIIDAFVNSVYVYDDRLLLTYNYKDGTQTLTLKEIEAALSSDLTSMCPPKREAHPLGVLLFLLGIGLEPI